MQRRRFSFSTAIDFQTALYERELEGYKFDIVVQPKQPGTKTLFVFFSGNAMRKKYGIPVFQRWLWADRFPGHTVYISDPTLHLDERLDLAWYAGDERGDPLPIIADIVRKIAGDLGVPLSRTFSYGSSGGGFAALRLALFLPEIGCIAINPQTDVTKFHNSQVEKYLRACFGGISRQQALEKIPDRLSLLHQTGVLAKRHIVYAQNTLDLHHYDEHFRPFVSQLSGVQTDGDATNVILFAADNGHRAPEPPAVLQMILAQASMLSRHTQQNATLATARQ